MQYQTPQDTYDRLDIEEKSQAAHIQTENKRHKIPQVYFGDDGMPPITNGHKTLEIKQMFLDPAVNASRGCRKV